MRLLHILPLVLLSPLSASAAAILGLDIGTEYIKAALVQPGIPLEIVLTKDSKRKEASAIGFKPTEHTLPTRLYGGDAITLAARYPAKVFPNLKQLLGKKFEDPEVAEYRRRYPALLMRGDEQGRILFQDQESEFTPEQLLAMQMRSVVMQAEGMGGAVVRGAVITIPAFWGAEERGAVVLAADMAGVKTLELVSDGMAVGLNYATTRSFDEKVPEYHVVYDMGAGSTTATVLRMKAISVKDVGRFNKTVQDVAVVGMGWDETLGGDLFNTKVVDLLVEDFASKKKVDPAAVRSNGRAAAKLWRDATKTRQVLSANTETFTSIESLYNDIDFRSGKITRAAFEAAIAEYEDRITKPIDDALKRAGISLNDVKSIIVHGGAVRTPFVGRKLEELIGADRISKNVNSDEAAVFGATFKGAGMSGAFKVRDIRTHDTNPYGVVAQFEDDKKELEVFPAGSEPGIYTTVVVPRKEDFAVKVKLVGKEELSKVEATNVTAAVAALKSSVGCEDITTKFKVRLGKKIGLPHVMKGWVECEVLETPVEDKKEDEGIVDGVKGFFGMGKKDKKGSSSESESSSSSSESSSSSKSTSTSTTTAVPTPTPVLKTAPLKLSSTRLTSQRLSPLELQAAKAAIQVLDAHDASLRALEESRNTLESLVYRARENLLPIPGLLSAPELETLTTLLSETGDWIYDDGASAPLDTVKQKLAELRKHLEPIEHRKTEEEMRPGVVEQLENGIKDAAAMGVVGLEDVQTWVKEVVAKQSGRKPWEDAAFHVREVEAKLRDVQTKVKELLAKKVKEEMEKVRKEKEEEKKRKEEEAAKVKEEAAEVKEEEETVEDMASDEKKDAPVVEDAGNKKHDEL